MDEHNLLEDLKRWLYTDPLVYGCITAQVKQGLSDKETLLMLVNMMAERHEHMERVYKNALARLPDSPFTKINV